MTRHNATWSGDQYYHESEINDEIENDDPRSDDHGKSGYFDYRDNT